ncbi:hypothetical protein [Chitinophaga agri]|uniref:Uncharacterized protein n=1 Tax=Chitinophaga agri TaxID=2703787 RepID=A0A6B9ZQG3_9BACT|nr:hypothetical protein [Chitinophaga agri]QHS63163.1 hypothetical protein GWR21_27315 [Chitinophaga agri]
MARTKNALLTGMKVLKSPATRKLMVKKIKGRSYVGKPPDMSHVVLSPAQLESNDRFAEAVQFARGIISDPVKKDAYKKRRGSSVYHSAIRDYMEQY